MTKQEFAQKHKTLAPILCCAMNALSGNRVRGVRYSVARFHKVILKDRGKDNRIEIGAFSTLDHVNIYVSGDRNSIVIEDHCHLKDVDICVEDSDNEFVFGARSSTNGKTKLCVLEGTRPIVGRDCLFADDILFRTSDSHSILDKDGVRSNRAADIMIGDHCWICTGVTVLKGTTIKENTVIGAGSVVSGKYDEPNCIIAGNPAHIVKRNTNWTVERK